MSANSKKSEREILIFVDPIINWGWRKGPSCHLYTNGSIEHLDSFALQLGLKKSHRHNDDLLPHYDLTSSKRTKAIELGAKEVDHHHLASTVIGSDI